MQRTCIENERQAEELIRRVDWPHAFIREMYLVSPSFVIAATRATAAPDALPTLCVLVVAADESLPGCELMFVEVEQLALWFQGELVPGIEFEKDGHIKWFFHKD